MSRYTDLFDELAPFEYGSDFQNVIFEHVTDWIYGNSLWNCFQMNSMEHFLWYIDSGKGLVSSGNRSLTELMLT